MSGKNGHFIKFYCIIRNKVCHALFDQTHEIHGRSNPYIFIRENNFNFDFSTQSLKKFYETNLFSMIAQIYLPKYVPKYFLVKFEIFLQNF